MEKYEPTSLEDYQIADNYEVSNEPEEDLEEADVEVEADAEVQPEEDFVENDIADETPAQEALVEQQNSQTPEQNAYYAEQRRQTQLQEQVQRELEVQRQQAPEFQIAQMLSEMYDMPVENLYEQLQEAAIAKKAEEQGVPFEVMRQLTQYEQSQKSLQERLNQMEFVNWKSRIDSEAEQLSQQFPMLSQEELTEAKFYLLDSLRNPDFPLQQAVFALHGDKIAGSLKNLAKQEAMAEISGRKKGGLPPQSMKTSDGQTLSEQERYVAKMMGISENDYMKWR
ncbi:hypothetical protein UFOVP451_56 [uncultured Caudovirales phage]|uniref:Uncharacterized protein n=1 Tax=uncultured Caudovirales phage TaxID=2100421 RepID=A0A6J5MGM6_9CAUD|nr:hypothetical protein UFOVP451_56 [uncultured Caudovirales phage]